MYRPVTASRKSFPLWIIILTVLGVLAALGLIIGLLVHFLAVENKIYYYKGSFKVLNIPYDRNYERETSLESNYLSKILEIKIADAFQSSNIYKQYINSQIITLVFKGTIQEFPSQTLDDLLLVLLVSSGFWKVQRELHVLQNVQPSYASSVGTYIPDSNSVTAHIWLVFKDPWLNKENLRRRIENILHQMLESNSGSLTIDSGSLKLMEITKVDAEKIINNRKFKFLFNEIWGDLNGNSQDWKNREQTNNPKNLTVSFGTRVTPAYMQHNVQEIIIHEDYVKGEHHDDVAVIKLTEKVSFRNDVHRVCLPEATQIFPPGEGVVVTGWGSLSYNGKSPLLLQKASIKIIDTDACNSEEAYGGRIEDTMLCAGYLEGSIDACQGDSGGPLVHPNPRDIWYLVGIVSWGHECGTVNKPGVYMRVTSYRDWIASKTGI